MDAESTRLIAQIVKAWGADPESYHAQYLARSIERIPVATNAHRLLEYLLDRAHEHGESGEATNAGRIAVVLADIGDVPVADAKDLIEAHIDHRVKLPRLGRSPIKGRPSYPRGDPLRKPQALVRLLNRFLRSIRAGYELDDRNAHPIPSEAPPGFPQAIDRGRSRNEYGPLDDASEQMYANLREWFLPNYDRDYHELYGFLDKTKLETDRHRLLRLVASGRGKHKPNTAVVNARGLYPLLNVLNGKPLSKARNDIEAYLDSREPGYQERRIDYHRAQDSEGAFIPPSGKPCFNIPHLIDKVNALLRTEGAGYTIPRRKAHSEEGGQQENFVYSDLDRLAQACLGHPHDQCLLACMGLGISLHVASEIECDHILAFDGEPAFAANDLEFPLGPYGSFFARYKRQRIQETGEANPVLIPTAHSLSEKATHEQLRARLVQIGIRANFSAYLGVKKLNRTCLAALLARGATPDYLAPLQPNLTMPQLERIHDDVMDAMVLDNMGGLGHPRDGGVLPFTVQCTACGTEKFADIEACEACDSDTRAGPLDERGIIAIQLHKMIAALLDYAGDTVDDLGRRALDDHYQTPEEET